MGIADSYRVLADAIADLEARGIEVTGVEGHWDDDLSVTVDLEIPADVAGRTRRAATTVEGGAIDDADSTDDADRSADDSGPPATESAPSERPAPRRGLVGVVLPARGESTDGGTDQDEAEGGSPVDDAEGSSDRGVDDSVGPEPESAAEASDETTRSTADEREAERADESPDGSIACRAADCDATFESEHGMKIHYSKVHRGSDGTRPYEDPEALREVYERHGTFAEMTAALDVDVSPNTVRRYMIDHGIHDPRPNGGSGTEEAGESADRPPGDADRDVEDGSDETGEAAQEPDGPERETAAPNQGADTSDGTDASSDEAPQRVDSGTASDGTGSEDESGDDVETRIEGGDEMRGEGGESDRVAEPDRADGDTRRNGAVEYDVPQDVDLPRGVTVEDVAAAVSSASTVYEVGRDLRVSRERAQRLLRDLGLLDLVTGRLATRPDPETVRSEVDARLRGTAEDGQVGAD